MAPPKFTSKDELLIFLKEQDLSGIDSEFSRSMMELVRTFCANGAHLDRWWVMTPVDWKCPACNRSKPQIVRLNRHGFLMGQLHEHHDHMKDFVKNRFIKISTSKKVVVADEMAEKFAIRTAFGLSAYDNTIICSDCNEADKNAKAIAKTHSYFSYSPSEILAFTRPRDNVGPHAIDENEAKRIWENGKELFKLRLDMVNQVAELAASNRHWYQPSRTTAAGTEKIANYWFRKYGLDDLSSADGSEPEKLLYTPVVFSGAPSAWRANKIRVNKGAPTDSDVQHLVATRGNFWKKVPENWGCPCCNRSKLSCVRPSNNNPWVFEIKEKRLFSEKKTKSTFMRRYVRTVRILRIIWGERLLPLLV